MKRLKFKRSKNNIEIMKVNNLIGISLAFMIYSWVGLIKTIFWGQQLNIWYFILTGLGLFSLLVYVSFRLNKIPQPYERYTPSFVIFLLIIILIEVSGNIIVSNPETVSVNINFIVSLSATIMISVLIYYENELKSKIDKRKELEKDVDI